MRAGIPAHVQHTGSGTDGGSAAALRSARRRKIRPQPSGGTGGRAASEVRVARRNLREGNLSAPLNPDSSDLTGTRNIIRIGGFTASKSDLWKGDQQETWWHVRHPEMNLWWAGTVGGADVPSLRQRWAGGGGKKTFLRSWRPAAASLGLLFLMNTHSGLLLGCVGLLWVEQDASICSAIPQPSATCNSMGSHSSGHNQLLSPPVRIRRPALVKGRARIRWGYSCKAGDL